MHLDTIFTFAGEDECIVFPPSIIDRKNNVTALSKRNGAVQSKSMPSLKIALEEFMERDITFIRCGGKNRTNQFREQWTDGANVLALASGIIVGYERNTNTFHALKEHGYNVVNQYEFIEEFKEKKFDPSGKKIAISFEGNELCRGRGGARCMTMPILRET
jgi:arginine deiminase